MPELIRMYIRNVLIGLMLAVIFTALLIGLNVANLRHLVIAVDVGWIAVILLIVFNTIVFAGVQFAIAVMRLAEDDSPPGGGKRQRVRQSPASPVPVPVVAGSGPQNRFRRARDPNFRS